MAYMNSVKSLLSNSWLSHGSYTGVARNFD